MSKTQKMNLEAFAALLAAYGADAKRWPEDRRQVALNFLGISAEARELRAEEAAFDDWLAHADPVGPDMERADGALVEALVAARPRPVSAPLGMATRETVRRRKTRGGLPKRLFETLWPYGSPVVPAALLLAAIIAGAGLGSAQVDRDGTDVAASTAVAEKSVDQQDEPIALALLDTSYLEDWQQ